MAKSNRVVVGNLGGVLCTVFTVQMVTRLLILPLTSKLYRHRGSCSLTLSLSVKTEPKLLEETLRQCYSS